MYVGILLALSIRSTLGFGLGFGSVLIGDPWSHPCSAGAGVLWAWLGEGPTSQPVAGVRLCCQLSSQDVYSVWSTAGGGGGVAGAERGVSCFDMF